MRETLRFRRCKKCRNMVDKWTGCDKIKCLCENIFCYNCEKNWVPGHKCPQTISFEDEPEPKVEVKHSLIRQDFEHYRFASKSCYNLLKK